MTAPESSSRLSRQRLLRAAGMIAIGVAAFWTGTQYGYEQPALDGDYQVRVDPKDLGGHVFGFTVTLPQQSMNGELRPWQRSGTINCPPGSLDGVLTLDDASSREIDALNEPTYDCGRVGSTPADVSITIGGALANAQQA